MLVGELFKAKDFDLVFKRMVVDYHPFFIKKTKQQVEEYKEKYEKAFKNLIRTKKSKSCYVLNIFYNNCGLDIWIDNVGDLKSFHSLKWGEIKGSTINSEEEDVIKMAATILWELTFYGFTELESILNFNKVKKALRRKPPQQIMAKEPIFY